MERALELFNGSGHQRTVAGLARTLGPPWVSALPDPTQASAVSVLVAWELSWYRYRVDLGDEADPVMMLDKGEELDQIDESLRAWNAGLDADGRVVAARASRRRFEGVIYCVVPQALADELYDKLADYYRDDPHVEVIIDRRAQGGKPGRPRGVRGPPPPAAQGLASPRSSRRA